MFKYCTITNYTLMNSVNPTKIYYLEKPYNKNDFPLRVSVMLLFVL